MTGKPTDEPSSSVVTPESGGAMMSANPSMMKSDKAPTMAMNGNPAAMMKAAERRRPSSAGRRLAAVAYRRGPVAELTARSRLSS